MNSKPKYLIVKGAGGGGIGDRLRCVLCGIAYAKLTNRTIYVDWSDGKLIPEYRNVFDDLFELKNINSIEHCPEVEDVFPTVWKGRLNESLHTLYTEFDPQGWNRVEALKRFSFDQTRLDYSNQVLVMWDFDQFDSVARLSNQQQSLKFARQLASKHIVSSQFIAQQIKEFCNKQFLVNEKIIGVHIRATSEFDVLKQSVQINQYIKAIDGFLKHSANKIFLATDNSSVENKINEEFQGLVITRDKWFAQPGEKIHFNQDCPDPQTALNDAAVEMFLLAQSDFLIYQQNSSFGMAAHILSHADEKNIMPLFTRKNLKNRIRNKMTGLIKRG